MARFMLTLAFALVLAYVGGTAAMDAAQTIQDRQATVYRDSGR